MKAKNPKRRDEMQPEYDFDYSKAVRGKCFDQVMKAGASVVILDPDVAKVFRTSEAVNDALRSLLKVSKAAIRATRRNGQKRKVAK